MSSFAAIDDAKYPIRKLLVEKKKLESSDFRTHSQTAMKVAKKLQFDRDEDSLERSPYKNLVKSYSKSPEMRTLKNLRSSLK